MCPFCISTVVSVAAGTVATAGVGSLFAFAFRMPARSSEVASSDEHRESERRDEPA